MPEAAGYRVYRERFTGAMTSGEGTERAATSFVATGLDNGEEYFFAITAVNSSGESDASETLACTPRTEPVAVTVSGTVQFDTGGPVEGAEVFGRSETSRIPGERTVSQMDGTSTNSSGEFSFQLGEVALPVQVVVEVSFERENLPVVVNSKWGEAESGSLDIGTIMLTDPGGAEVVIAGGAGAAADGSVRFENLPAKVDRLFARAYDPDETPEAFPGDFSDAGRYPLNSSVFVWVEALDASGDPVNDLSRAVSMRTRVPQQQWGDLIDLELGNGQIDVPLYFFDEDLNVWQQQGRGWLVDASENKISESAQDSVLDGSYSGEIYFVHEVEHFSYVNLDAPCMGPWPIGGMPSPFRNRDCTEKGLKLAETIIRTEYGKQAFKDVNKPDGDLDEELPDWGGPQLKVDNFGDRKIRGEYQRNDKRSIKVSNKFWGDGTGCNADDPATREAEQCSLGFVVLHETAHWKHTQVKNDGKFSSEHDVSGEAGNHVIEDLLGRDVYQRFYFDAAGRPIEMTDSQRSRICNPEWWEDQDRAGNLNRRTMDSVFNDNPAIRAGNQADDNPLSVTLSAVQSDVDFGQPIELEVTYRNSGHEEIFVLNLVDLRSYPVYWRVIENGTDTLAWLGPRFRIDFDPETDMTELAPGEELSATFTLETDSNRAARYPFKGAANYEISAIYSSHFGLPETESDSVSVTVGGGTASTVTGTVTSAEDSSPVEGVQVAALQGRESVTTATTDAQGEYRLDLLGVGPFTVLARVEGFNTGSMEGISGDTSGLNFELVPFSAPEFLGEADFGGVDTPIELRQVVFEDGVLYGVGDGGFAAFDLSSGSPVLLDSFTGTDFGFWRLVVHGGVAYIAGDVEEGLVILDVSDPADISLISRFMPGAFNGNLFAEGNRLYQGGLFFLQGNPDPLNMRVWDVGDPSNPTLIGEFFNQDLGAPLRPFVVRNQTAYVRLSPSLFSVDVSDAGNPGTPFELEFANFNSQNLELEEDLLLLTRGGVGFSAGPGDVFIYDLEETPDQLAEVGHIEHEVDSLEDDFFRQSGASGDTVGLLLENTGEGEPPVQIDLYDISLPSVPIRSGGFLVEGDYLMEMNAGFIAVFDGDSVLVYRVP